MKRVLGLDLGTTSIGWAIVNQAETAEEKSSIIRTGVRVNPLTADEKDSFEKGKAITTNADRRLKRGMRRNLQRYKLRRDHLISVLRREGWIREDTLLSEQGAASTYQTFKLRADATSREISLEDLSRVLLMINRKRGYKSNRRTDTGEEGHLIDGMEVARTLYDEGLTPAQYSLRLLGSGSKITPDYYRSDLVQEFEKIWAVQAAFWPEILTDEFKHSIEADSRNGVSKKFFAKYGIYTADNKGKDRKRVALEWRVKALTDKLEQDVLAYVIADVKGEIQNAGGYLGAISDRSKELVFAGQTVGQYLYRHIQEEPNYSTRNQVFYRQDYLDEFEKIWECQKQFHPELTDELKSEIRDIVIFYQRRLKSQKNLISICEFEHREVEIEINGEKKLRTLGCRVAPRSSLLFQEFKIWSVLNNVAIRNRGTGESRTLTDEEKKIVSDTLKIREKLKSSEMLRLLGCKPSGYEVNYPELQGNLTMAAFYRKFIEIIAASGHGDYDIDQLTYDRARDIISEVFSTLCFNTGILSFDSSLPKEEYERQPLFKLWHLLYSYEGDNSTTGDESLVRKIAEICGMPAEYARLLTTIRFVQDYASLSHKAMRKILPHLKDGCTYDVACSLAGYNHSSSVTSEENAARELKDRLEVLPKGALRNPVVEKILNQMINVVNALSDEYGKPDEIHIELARELKQSARQREKATKDIADRTKDNESKRKTLQDEFHLSYVSAADILRYRLYEELEFNGYKTLYSNKYIPRELLFSKDINIEHIIPRALFFDDSYSNKTLEFSDINREKDKYTAYDYVHHKYGDAGLQEYVLKVNDLVNRGAISRKKGERLLMTKNEIPVDFLNRDLTNTQYIARMSMEILRQYVRTVVPTNGNITARLREEWQLVDIMKELNMPKYRKVGRTYLAELSNGQTREDIKGWTKRDDHRHHAMDALTIAFTRPAHIQVLNSLNALEGAEDYSLKLKMTTMVDRKRKFIPPMPLGQLRAAFKDALESTLVSIKAKNKVATKSVNRAKIGDGKTLTVSTLTPRGQLHEEHVYGKHKVYDKFEVPVDSKLTVEIIACIASKAERLALMKRLEEFGGDPKKAFTGKNLPDTLPTKVKCVRFKDVYTIRKEISPELNIKKVVDGRVKKILQVRLSRFGGDPKKAFVNLDEDPIWFDESRGVKLKSVTVEENGSIPPTALRDARNKDGQIMLDTYGHTIPADFVNLSNNHHAAIYQDADGKFHDIVIPLMVAFKSKSAGCPVVDRDYKKEQGWSFVFSIKKNEMFVFPNAKTGFCPEDIDLTNPANYAEISPNLFRAQNISKGDYFFSHHLVTSVKNLRNDFELKDITWKRITGLNNLQGVVKVRIDHIGRIVAVGEY